MAATSVAADSSFRYWVFISYADEDFPVAQWLHVALETYGIPKVLVGTITGVGTVPRRLYPAFLDRDELPLAVEGDQVEWALRQSRNLIVINSKNTAASAKVDREVRYFESLGRGDRIAVVQVDSTELPPGSLQGRQLFKVDLADGKIPARLKLVAWACHVNYADINQRDHQRLQRRMQVVLAGTGLVLMLFVGLAGQAMVERRRAEGALQEAMMEKQKAEQHKAKAERAMRKAQELEYRSTAATK